MPEIGTVITTVPYGEEEFAELCRALEPARILRCAMEDSAAIASALEVADVAILGGDLDERYYRAPHIRWIHCDHAGLNRSAKPEVFERGILLTSSAGRSAPALAEHAMLFMLTMAFHTIDFYEAQKRRQWGVPDQDSFRCLYGKSVAILGMGNTGKELAKRAHAFEMRVTGYDRPGSSLPTGFDARVDAGDRAAFEKLLASSDFVVLALPLTDETHHLIGARELSLMKQSAYLINMARGAIVDEQALSRALHAGEIAGAGLDTFETEPLPAESPLWNAPHTLLTPHVTPQVPSRTRRSLEIICENIRRYRAGEALLNQVTVRDVYTRG